MKKYGIISAISFLLAVCGMIFMLLFYFKKIDSVFILWLSLGLIIVAAILSIYRWLKTRKKKKKNKDI